MLRKPAWLSCRDYDLFLEKWTNVGGRIICNHPECSRDADTIDHVISRIDPTWADNPKKAHESSNLQPMCRSHNSCKGTEPDSYWSKKLYFDNQLNLSNLRASQRDFVYYPIKEYAEFFAGGFSQINGKLFAFIQVTGAGKSIGEFVLPFAINHACLDYSQPPNKLPRISRMLILVKEKPLRDQLARELKEEPIKFGIVKTPPNVEIAHGSDDLMAYSRMKVDIVVCCVHSLWSGERSIPNLRHFLAQFQLISFDEFHYAHEHVRAIVRLADQSIVVGFTATPLSATGDLLDDIVKVTSYGYYQACAQDNSMKSLGEATNGGRQLYPEFKDVIEEIEPSEIKDLHGRYVSDDEVFGCQLPSILNIGSATIERLKLLDMRGYDRMPAGHRNRHHSMDVTGIDASEEFPSHAIIRTPTISEAEYLTDWLNKRFDQDRVNYPAEKGYRAVCAHGENDHFPRHQLDNCDWFWSLNHNGELSSQAARILVVSNLAKEGTNNKFCNVISWAKTPQVDREIIQALGRALRSCHVLEDDGLLRVPDYMLDQIYVITHKLWGEGETFAERQRPLIEALRYLENAERLDDVSGILTIDRWLEARVDGEFDDSDATIDIRMVPHRLPMMEMLQIVHVMADAHLQGKPIRLTEVHEITNAVNPRHRREQTQLIENMAGGDRPTLYAVNQRFATLSVLGPDLAGLIVEETIDTQVEGEESIHYITKIDGCETLQEKYRDDPAGLQTVCDALASQVRASFYQPAEIELPQTLPEIIGGLADRISTGFSRPELKPEIIDLLWEGLNMLLDRCDTGPIPSNSRYNLPQLIIKLQCQVYQNKLMGHVIRRLHQNHRIDAEAYVMGLDDAIAGRMSPDNDDD